MKPRFSICPILIPTTNTEHIYVAYTFKVKLSVCTCLTKEDKIWKMKLNYLRECK